MAQMSSKSRENPFTADLARTAMVQYVVTSLLLPKVH